MPVNWKDYPPNWKQIAFEKKESVDWKCENCGKQCRRPGEPFDTHLAEIEKVEIQMHGPNSGWVHLPVNLKKVDAENGLKGFCGTCSSVRIPKAIPEGLPDPLPV